MKSYNILHFTAAFAVVLLCVVGFSVVVKLTKSPGSLKQSRIELIEAETIDRNRMRVLKDNESGILYLSYNGGLVKLEPAPAAPP